MENLSHKKRIHRQGTTSNGLSSYVNNFRQSENSSGRKNKTGDRTKDEVLNKSSYKWMYSKLLNYYAIFVLGLLGLTFFDVVTIEVFVTGVFSAFSICIAMIGHGIADLIKQNKNAVRDLWETQDESTINT